VIPIHGTPCGEFERNRGVLSGQYLCLSWTSYARRRRGRITGVPTESALAHAHIAAGLLLDNGAFPIWRAQERYVASLTTGKPRPKPPKMNVRAVISWYRALIAVRPRDTTVLIPDSITGGERANDLLLDAFPVDLIPVAWPVWHTEESLERFARLARRFGRVAIGAMGRHRHICGPEYTSRMIQVFNLRAELFPDLPVHMLRGLQLAGGPFPFVSGDSTDLGRNWSQTPQRLGFALNRWSRRAARTAKTWHPKAMNENAIYGQVRQVTLADYLHRSAA